MYIIYKIRKFFNISDQFVQLSEVTRSYAHFEIFKIHSILNDPNYYSVFYQTTKKLTTRVIVTLQI